ncbi:MAG: hypothetical protein WB767_01835, partial [Nocardioides sp.]
VFVRDTGEESTERALAAAALGCCREPRAVVVGGLGLGFLMHEVLSDSRVERCAVVEREQALVDWMRDGTIAHGPALLADERVRVVVADLAVAVAEAQSASYDLVLLNGNNGPISRRTFLGDVARILRPGGVVVVSSAANTPEVAGALARVFDDTDVEQLDVARRGCTERYWLYLARTAAGPE